MLSGIWGTRLQVSLARRKHGPNPLRGWRQGLWRPSSCLVWFSVRLEDDLPLCWDGRLKPAVEKSQPVREGHDYLSGGSVAHLLAIILVALRWGWERREGGISGMGRVKQVQSPVAVQVKFLSVQALHTENAEPPFHGAVVGRTPATITPSPDGPLMKAGPPRTPARPFASLLRTGLMALHLRGSPVALNWPISPPSHPWEVQHVAGIIVHGFGGGALVLHTL